MNFIDISFNTADQFALFDDDDKSFREPLKMLGGGALIGIAEVSSTGNWTANLGGESITLGGDGWFHFALRDGNIWRLQDSISSIVGNTYKLTWDSGPNEKTAPPPCC